MKNILVVDDELSIRELLAETFSNDYDVGVASNGLDAMGLIVKHNPDLIIIDYNMNMPYLDGLSVVEYILERPENRDIKFILMSGYLNEEQLDRWQQLIANSVFFLKPLDLAKIKLAVASLTA